MDDEAGPRHLPERVLLTKESRRNPRTYGLAATGVWVYKQTEKNPALYTVGFYSPAGVWHPESDHANAEDAANRVHWLNAEDSL